MTTQVIVKANHGWAVEVMQLTTRGEVTSSAPQRVEPGQEVNFACHADADLLIHEVQPGASWIFLEEPEPIMQFFDCTHLPPKLIAVANPFWEMAKRIVRSLPRNAERTVALRKLLEAKDAAVRAALVVS